MSAFIDESISPVITAFLETWHEAIQDSTRRTELIRPLVPHAVGTRTTREDDVSRAWMAADWMIRSFAPAFLALPVSLRQHARTLSEIPPVTDKKSAESALEALGSAASAAKRLHEEVVAYNAHAPLKIGYVAGRDAAARAAEFAPSLCVGGFSKHVSQHAAWDTGEILEAAARDVAVGVGPAMECARRAREKRRAAKERHVPWHERGDLFSSAEGEEASSVRYSTPEVERVLGQVVEPLQYSAFDLVIRMCRVDIGVGADEGAA